MEIKTSTFSRSDIESKEMTSSVYGDYTFHSVTIDNVITINDVEHVAIYQNGLTFEHNDYNCPSNDVALSEEGGADSLLVFINELYESDFDDEEYINEKLSELKDISNVISSVSEMYEAYMQLMDNNSAAKSYFNEVVEELTEE